MHQEKVSHGSGILASDLAFLQAGRFTHETGCQLMTRVKNKPRSAYKPGNHVKYIALLLLTLAGSTGQSLSKEASSAPQQKYDRAQNLVINLNTQVGSSGFYLLKCLSDVKTIDHDLGKAGFQVEQVDKTYAKLRGRPDDRYLSAVNIKIQKAIETRRQLEMDIRDAYEQLKDSIQDTIITDEERKKKPKTKEQKNAKQEFSGER